MASYPQFHFDLFRNDLNLGTFIRSEQLVEQPWVEIAGSGR
ncbi:hypothetical protein BH24ACT12_BH24ACT12_10360 [soil metagenome]